LNPEKGVKPEQYIVPMKTFWLPVLVDNDPDPNLDQPKYQKHLFQMPGLNEQNYGECLAPTLRQSMLQTDLEKMKMRKEGGHAAGLRDEHAEHFAESITMKKYESAADEKTTRLIDT